MILFDLFLLRGGGGGYSRFLGLFIGKAHLHIIYFSTFYYFNHNSFTFSILLSTALPSQAFKSTNAQESLLLVYIHVFDATGNGLLFFDKMLCVYLTIQFICAFVLSFVTWVM